VRRVVDEVHYENGDRAADRARSELALITMPTARNHSPKIHEHDRLQHGGVAEDEPGDFVGLDASAVNRGSRRPNGCVG
jgi:hypothetical protein